MNNQPLHVAMVSETFYPFVGGVAVQLLACAQALVKHGVRISIITKQRGDALAYELFQGISVYRIASKGPRVTASTQFVFGAVQRLRQLQPDVIHAHELLLPTTAALLAKRLLHIPLVVTIHASGPEIGEVARVQRAKFGKQRWVQLQKHVDRFVAISQVTDQDLAQAGIPAEKRVAIPIGVEMHHFAPVSEVQKRAIRRQLMLDDLPTVIYTGRLASEKRVMTLVDLWPAIRRQLPTAQLLIVGSGTEGAALQRRAGAGIRFVGDQENVATWLQASDLFVMPSVSEGFSLSTLEASAVGLPCVTTTVGAIPEFIVHGKNGWLVPPDDGAALESALVTVMNDLGMQKRFAVEARSAVVERYAIQSVAQQLETLYRSVSKAGKHDA